MTEPSCLRCGLETDVASLGQRVFRDGMSGFRARFGIRCPRCKAVIPAFESQCKNCGATLVESIKGAAGRNSERLRKLVAPTPTKKRLFQWFYFLASVAIAWFILAFLERRYSKDWLLHMSLTPVYLSVFFLLSLWVIPPKTIIAFRQRTSVLVKLGVICNAVTLLMLLQVFLATWWARSLMLATLFIATWLGAWIFWRFLWPMSNIMNTIYTGDVVEEFDPQSPQGRKAYYD